MKNYFLCIIMFFSYNLYFIFLMRDKHVGYLIYLDLLVGALVLTFAGADLFKYIKKKQKKERLLEQDEIISTELSDFENSDIAAHDLQILNRRLQEQFDENCELQDYVGKWCHEVKIPLAAGLLMNEKIKDPKIRKGMREQLERINQQLNTMLLGCKLQSPLFDLQIKKTLLPECVRTSIRNNQFFLIQKGFELDIRVAELTVFTDPAWLVYILDQLLNNAIKYVREKPVLHIWTEQKEQSVELLVEDQGEGILEQDIRRIFEKGFTGSNNHNGRYKSTGMGLYMAAKITGRLGHEIKAESKYGAYTRFRIVFRDNDYFQM